MGFSHSLSARVWARLFLEYSHKFPGYLIQSVNFLKSSHRQNIVQENRGKPSLASPPVGAGRCPLSPASRRSVCCKENVKNERDPRLHCSSRKKVSALCTACFISIRVSVILIQLPTSFIPLTYKPVCIFQLQAPERVAPAPKSA